MDKQIILICFNICFNRIRFKSYENKLPGIGDEGISESDDKEETFDWSFGG